MTIGLTYDLRSDYLKEGFSEEETAEFDKEDTIEGIEQAIEKMGFKTERIGNVKALVKKLQEGKRWDLVFNIAEGLYGIGREAQIPALLDAYRIPYTFSDPMVLSLTLHKGMTKRIIRDLGIPTADFFVLETLGDLSKVNLPFPLFAKPVAEGTGKGIHQDSKIKTREELDRVCKKLLKEFNQPVLIETFLPGREFTVGITGTGEDSRIAGGMEVIFKSAASHDTYSYSNKANYKEVVDYKLMEGNIAKECSELCLKVWKGLGCRDGGRIDIRYDQNGIPNFIEINPLAGLNPKDSDLPIICYLQKKSYQELIESIVNSALKRIKKQDLQ